jgi:hypothetical protein
MSKKPVKIKLDPETPSIKDVKTIPLLPLNSNQYDIEMTDDLFEKYDLPQTTNENNSQNNTDSI